MTDEANDRREGYADGMAKNSPTRTDRAYYTAWKDGIDDRIMLAQVAEWKRRALLPVATELDYR